jgi:hypothetical protein
MDSLVVRISESYYDLRVIVIFIPVILGLISWLLRNVINPIELSKKCDLKKQEMLLRLEEDLRTTIRQEARVLFDEIPAIANPVNRFINENVRIIRTVFDLDTVMDRIEEVYIYIFISAIGGIITFLLVFITSDILKLCFILGGIAICVMQMAILISLFLLKNKFKNLLKH